MKQPPEPNRTAPNRMRLPIFLLLMLCLCPHFRSSAAGPNPFGISSTKLNNGMEIVAVENHGLPLVTIEIVARNGSYTEPPEFSGLSHLYEHMFFKANAAIPSQEKYMERLRELGAHWNGSTGEEAVNYFMTVHKKNLRDGAVFMRDALLHPLFKEEELKREFVVVLGEFDRNEANPVFHLERETDRLQWSNNFCRKNPLGDRDVILNTTREQMETIQRRYYVPNNCALFVAGDVNPDEVFQMARELFGDWPRSADPHKQWPEPEMSPIKNTQQIAVVGPVKTISIEMSWHGPSVRKNQADTYAADVFSYILDQPDSKFQKTLVDGGLVDEVGLSYHTLAFTGPISLTASTTSDRLDKALAAIRAEIEKFDSPDYITEEQIQSAKNMLEIGDVRSREQTTSFCHALGFWWSVAGLDYYTNYLDNLRKVGRKDLVRYIRNYIKGKARIEAALVSEDNLKQMEFAKTAKVIHPESGSSAAAFAKKEEAKPAKAAVTTEEFDVDGLKVVLRHNPANEIVVAQMAIYGGLQYYGGENAGRELLLLETLDKGSAAFPKEEVNRQLARTGASLSADSRHDYSVFGLSTLARDLDKNFAIFADALTHPLLSDEEVKLGVERRLNAIKMLEEHPDAFIAILAGRNFFKGHPYASPPGGVESAIKGLTANDLKRIHKDTFLRSRMKLFVVGNVEKGKLTELIRAGLKDLPPGLYTPQPMARKEKPAPELLTEKRALPTNYVFGCFDAPTLSSPDYAPLQVALSILDDRLFEEVRTKRNLSYAVSAQISSRLSNYGVLYVTTVKPNDAIKVMLDEVERIAKEPVSDKELKDKIEEMITSDLMRKQTNASQAASLVLFDATGPGWSEADHALDKISAVTAAQVREVSARYLKKIDFSVLGDPEKVDAKLFTSR